MRALPPARVLRQRRPRHPQRRIESRRRRWHPPLLRELRRHRVLLRGCLNPSPALRQGHGWLRMVLAARRLLKDKLLMTMRVLKGRKLVSSGLLETPARRPNA